MWSEAYIAAKDPTSKPKRKADIVGRWYYGDGKSYRIRDLQGLLIFEEKAQQGELVPEGTGYVSTLIKTNGDVHGTIRLRFQEGAVTSQFKSPGEKWGPDILATSEAPEKKCARQGCGKPAKGSPAYCSLDCASPLDKDGRRSCANGHELKYYLRSTPGSNNCDGCGRRGIKAPEHIFRCEACDFDLCQACFGQDRIKVGARVDAKYKGEWYRGTVKKLRADDKDAKGRYTVQCDCDKAGLFTYTSSVKLIPTTGKLVLACSESGRLDLAYREAAATDASKSSSATATGQNDTSIPPGEQTAAETKEEDQAGGQTQSATAGVAEEAVCTMGIP
jgi:hypothetical protein